MEVVKLDGNPMCAEQEAYRLYAIAHLVHLKYLDYVLVDEADKARAGEEYRDELNKDAADTAAEQAKKREEDEDLAQLEDAGLGPTYNALSTLREEFKEDLRKIRLLPGVQSADEDFQASFREATSAFQAQVMKLNASRLEMICKFKQAVKRAEDVNEQEDIASISKYERLERQALRAFEQGEQDDAAEAALKEVFGKINELEHLLIGKEMQLVERVNEAGERFEKAARACTEGIRAETKSYQEDLNKEIDLFLSEVEKAKEEQLKRFFSEGANAENYSPEQTEVYQDKEGLSSSITLLAEELKNLVFQVEEEVNKFYEEETESFVTSFKEQQHDRNRRHTWEVMELVKDKRGRIHNALDSA